MDMSSVLINEPMSWTAISFIIPPALSLLQLMRFFYVCEYTYAVFAHLARHSMSYSLGREIVKWKSSQHNEEMKYFSISLYISCITPPTQLEDIVVVVEIDSNCGGGDRQQLWLRFNNWGWISYTHILIYFNSQEVGLLGLFVHKYLFGYKQ